MGLFRKKETVPSIPDVPKVISSKTPVSASSIPSPPKNQDAAGEVPDLPAFGGAKPPEKDTIPSVPVKEAPKEETQVTKEMPQANTLGGTALLPAKSNQSSSPVPNPPESRPVRLEKKIELTPSRSIQKLGSSSHENEPIFVRLDKFQSAQKNLDSIKEKIEDIEITLRKIKEVKSREEEELTKWAAETEKLKALTADIDEDIFSKI